eukprot:764923-Hanusia_phi.AAC.16
MPLCVPRVHVVTRPVRVNVERKVGLSTDTRRSSPPRSNEKRGGRETRLLPFDQKFALHVTKSPEVIERTRQERRLSQSSAEPDEDMPSLHSEDGAEQARGVEDEMVLEEDASNSRAHEGGGAERNGLKASPGHPSHDEVTSWGVGDCR